MFFVKICFGIYNQKLPFKSCNMTMQEKDNGILLKVLLKHYSNMIIMRNNNSL